MLRSFARTTGFLVYLFITLEMLIMIGPFAVYYYSVYSPVLAAPSRLADIAWLPAFFLPHLSREIVPSIGGVIFLLGLIAFLLCALQLYYAKFRQRGVVRNVFYKRIRHPQYLCLAFSGLGLLIVWPRFILLIAYVNMLWLYYFLARDEERRMEDRYGEVYADHRRRSSMFLPGEPGGRLSRRLFGRIHDRRARLVVIYGFSLAGSIGAAFVLRGLGLHLTTHLSLPDRKTAAVSFLSGGERQLRELVESAEGTTEIQNRIKHPDDWVLVQAMEGNRPLVHVMIDAGMTRPKARSLPVAKEGIKLVFSRRNGPAREDPFSARARWRPVFVVEMNGQKVSRAMDIDKSLFLGNPVMPVF